MFKGIDKKRHTRAPYEIHTLEGMVKKRHPHAHAYHQGYLYDLEERPGVIFQELKWYIFSFFMVSSIVMKVYFVSDHLVDFIYER